MIDVSTEFEQALENGERNFCVTLTINLQDATVLDIDDSDLWSD